MENNEFKIAFDLIEHTANNVFLTGKAGTGKTTFLKYLVAHSVKNLVVAAPTGVAAINAGGVTLHSLFGLPLLGFIPSNDYVDPNIALNRNELSKHFRYHKNKRELFLQLELLIIDEISMVRADLLDAIDFALQYARKNSNPFGGVQTLFIGDMYQLPPILKEEMSGVLKKYYTGPYFFESKTIQQTPPICVELKKIHRQDDEEFIEILNKIRFQKLDKECFQKLNTRYFPNYEIKENSSAGYIYLTTHNATVDQINQKQLQTLRGTSFYYRAEIEGEFKESAYPNNLLIELKVGAQIMFIRNDISENKKYFNGKIATVSNLSEDSIKILFEGDKEEYELTREVWENKQYYVDTETNEIKENIIGQFMQFPIRLAWAVTIHKSQGLTFDKAIIDAGRSFAPGQVYVALSRCRTLEGIILKSEISEHCIFSDKTINEFQRNIRTLSEIEKIVEKEKFPYSLKRISHALKQDTLISSFLLWKEFIMEKKIPKKEETALLADMLMKQLHEMGNIEKKFSKQLQGMYHDLIENKITYEQIEERSSKGVIYFAKEATEKILFPLQIHKFQIDKAKKVKGYTKFLNELVAKVSTKIKQWKELHLLEKKLYTLLPEEEPMQLINSIPIDSEKKQKLTTYEITEAILKEGKSIEETAKERNFSITTIYSHIAKMIEKGRIDAVKYIEPPRMELIINIIKKIENASLTSIKNELDNSYTFEEIKIALSEYNRRKTLVE